MNKKLGLVAAVVTVLASALLINVIFTNKLPARPNTTPNYSIINVHEHLESFEVGETKLLPVMNQTGIKKTVLLGSPEATLYTGRKGFSGQDANNQEIVALAKAYPERFLALCTINPADEDKLAKFQECMSNGALGLKLYSGHSIFYELPLNESSMYPIFEYSARNRIPVLWHVNAGKPKYMAEFEAVLKDFPNMTVICPHFCLSSINISRLNYLLSTYPNLYTDVSFGAFAGDGLKRVSKNTTKYASFIKKYKDRFMFGTDMVVTSAKRKTVEWLSNLTMCYRNMIEKDTYSCRVAGEIDKQFNGLGLDEETLKKVYQQNFEDMMSR
jgi:predicted TIM-barrel fold metal-dependent hydrolase